jgi:trehalose-phosphatase
VSRADNLVERLRELERPLLIALDVDGTISQIVRDPDMAEIPAETLATIAALSAVPNIEIALITGRDLESLRRMEQLDGIWRAVEHGGVVLGPGEVPGERELSADQRDALERFESWARVHADGAFIECKPQAVAVHVRAIAMEDPARAERLMNEADALAQRLGLHARRGKALREAEAEPHDKGLALREILQRSGARSVLFIGDDLTDFPAIDLASQHGIGAFVQSPEQRGTPSSAAVLLDGVDDVMSALRGLLASVQG